MFDLNNIQSIVIAWVATNGVKIVAILVGAWVVHFIITHSVDRIIRRVVTSDHFPDKEAEKKREDTLIRIIHGTAHVLLIVFTGLMIMSNLGMDIGPLLAGAGIVGLAFGFGGQYLIKDVISGLFIILENQYRVKDVVCFDKTCGLVEEISLRMTTLRDMDGNVHHVPHGAINTVTNMSKFYSRVNLDIGVSYSADLEHVIKVVNQVGNDLANDPEWKEKIIKAPQFLRVNEFADSSVVIKILGDTKPIEQWAVAGELRKRLKIAFDREGIEIPFPQRVIHTSKS